MLDKEALEERIVGMFSEYISKYIKKQYRNADTYTEFQRAMVKNSQWSESKVEREFDKFIKFTKLSKEELDDVIYNFIILSVRVLTYGYDSSCMFETLRDHIPISTLFHKTLKRASKYFYENPKARIQMDKGLVVEAIADLVPFKQLMLLYKQFGDDAQDVVYKFDDCDTISPQEHNDKHNNVHNNVPNDKHNVHNNVHNDLMLRYVPSEELEEINFSLQNLGEVHTQDQEVSDNGDVRHVNLARPNRRFE
jgi:hypothetical protein